jgi:hypothetical protein
MVPWTVRQLCIGAMNGNLKGVAFQGRLHALHVLYTSLHKAEQGSTSVRVLAGEKFIQHLPVGSSFSSHLVGGAVLAHGKGAMFLYRD